MKNKKCHFLSPEYKGVYEALARFARSRILSKVIIFSTTKFSAIILFIREQIQQNNSV